MAKWDNKKSEELFKAILKLKNIKESKIFFRDLLTEKEIIEFGNRWKAVGMLDQGIPYTKIEKETGLSSRTVARISWWLQNGKGGYGVMLKRVNKNYKKEISSRKKF